MSGDSVLAHDNCARVTLMLAPVSAWAELPKCPTCDALDAIWQRGYEQGQRSGKSLGRYEERQERTERLTTAARTILLLVIMCFLVDIINHRPEGVTE